MKHSFRLLLLVVMLLVGLGVDAQTQTWQTLHKVKRSETIFGIANDYDVSIQNMLDANPVMKQEGFELKKGMWIYVPFARKKDKAAKKPVTFGKPLPPKVKRAIEGRPVRVGVMLPLHNKDGDGLRMVEYYRGLLLAFKQLMADGINTDVHAWNVPKDADISKTLADPAAANLDMIIGPLYTEQVKPLGDFCIRHGIKLIIPFSIEGDDVAHNPMIFQVYQSDEELNAKAVGCFLERFQRTHHPVLIDCNDKTSRVGLFTKSLRSTLKSANIGYDLTDVNTPMTDFMKHFSAQQPNVVVINSEKSPMLNRVFHKLDSLKTVNPGLAIAMYGYNDWFMYQDYDLNNFYKYAVHIPSTYYYNKVADKTEAFEKLYHSTYGEDMSKRYIPRLALTGYDHGEFFVRGISQYGKAFDGKASSVKYRPLQTRLNFERVGSGGFKNNHFQIVRFNVDQTMNSLVY